MKLNKKTFLTLIMGFVCSLSAVAQSHTMLYQAWDTATSCTGTLYDNGGPSGNYANYSDDYFVLDVNSGSLNITFSQFNTANYSDRIYIYDGVGTGGTILLNHYGSYVPNNGNPINVPSGKATIYFYSNYYGSSSGFALSWSTGGTSAPTPQFSVSNPNPPVNTAVSFTNSTTNGGTYSWDFGDGNSSTLASPQHSYAAPGTYSVTLTATNCFGSATSSAQNVTVMASPNFTITPDSLYASVSCGSSVNTNFTINHNSGGTMIYDVTGRELNANPYAFATSFELGLAPFTVSPNAHASFNANAVVGGAAKGNNSLLLTGYTSGFDGLIGNFASTQATSFSYYIKPSNATYHGAVALGNDPDNTNEILYYAQAYYGDLRVYTGNGTYSHPINSNQWNLVEVKNINYTNHTYDLFINNIQVATAYSFNNTATNTVNQVHLWNGNGYNCYFDAIKVGKQVISPLSLSPQSGVLSSSNSNTVSVSASTTGKVAGRYLYEVVVGNNSTGLDSNYVIPMVVDITGAAGVNLSKTCINYGNVFSTLSPSDSVMIYNSGCDSLDISAITSTSGDIVPSATSLMVPPFDTTYLHVTLSPSTVGTYTDTLYLTTNDVDTIICINANSIAAPVINTDSTNYNLASVGCNDSIPFSFKLYNDGGSALTWSLGTSSSVFDDFESGMNTTIWSSFGSSSILTACLTNSGVKGLSMDGNNRNAVTKAIQVNAGDSLKLWAYPGNSSSGCENPDGGEDVYVEYSTNGGSTWSFLGGIYNYNTAPQFYSWAIPVSGQVNFRLRQTSHSGTGYDNYIIDDFSIVSSSSGSFTPSYGSLTAADSITVSGYFDVAGLTSGTYSRKVRITSNDPVDSSYTINVDIDVQGESEILTPATCLAMGSVMNGTTASDSVVIFNTGCADLTLSGTTVTNSDFSVTTPVTTITPGDSAFVFVSYTPTTIGAVNDTIFIASNDTTGIICLTADALGAPNASITPDTVYMSFTSCSDSATVPLTLKNMAGQDTLLYSISGNSSSSGVEVVFMNDGAYYTEFNNLLSLMNGMSGINVTPTFASTATTLSADLTNADVLLIPERSNSTSLFNMATEIQNFASSGGTVIVLLNNSSVLTTIGLIGGSTSGAGYQLSNLVPSHPIMQNVPAISSEPNATSETVISSPTAQILMNSNYSNSSEAVVAIDQYGSGKVAYLGFDYYQYFQEQEDILEQALNWGKRNLLANYLSINPDTGAVAIDDSVTLNLKITTLGLQNGRHSSTVSIATNDPANPTLDIPVVIDINGSAEVAVIDTSCVSFTGIQQGATAADSVSIYNTGCDTLEVTSFTSSMTDFGIGNLPMSLAPGDTMPVLVQFTPVGVGTFSDTITVNTNDTTFTICVSGTSVGAPVIDLPVDSLVVDVNKCKVIKNEVFKINNTGQGAMTYDMKIGGYYGQSQIAYTTNGATTTHTFTGVPTSDTVRVRVILHGDYDSYYERTYMELDNSYYYGSVYDNNKNYVNDTIEYMWWGTTAQNWTSDGTFSVELSNNYDVDGGAGSFHRVEVTMSSSVNWVSVIGSTTGTVAANGSVNKNMLFNAASLPVGTYNTILNITTNTPGQPTKSVPVIMNVVEEPELSVSDTCVIFPLTLLGDTTTKTFTVYNNGCKQLNVSSILAGNNDFKITPSNGIIPVDDSLQVSVSFTPTSITTYSSSILMSSNDTSAILCLRALSGALPEADFQFSYQNGCLGEVVFADESKFSPNSWFWQFGDGNTSTQRNPSHMYAKAGTYKVSLRVTNSTGFDTTSSMITVNPLYANFSMTDDTTQVGAVDTVLINTNVYFHDSSEVPISWDWNFGDGSTSTSQNPVHSFANKGKYQVSLEVQDSRGCNRTVVKDLFVKSDVSIDEFSVDGHSYDLYPNPSAGVFNLEAEGLDWSEYQLQVIDARGSLIRTFAHPAQGASISIDLSDLRMGVYQLMILKNSELKGRQSLILK